MELPEAAEMLSRTPDVLDALLTGLPPQWLHHNDGPGTWSAYDIVGHLLHGDGTNWLPRARMILDRGAEAPFEPFDREAMLSEEHADVSVLLARFRTARRASLGELSAMDIGPGDMERRGLHPDLGEVTLSQLLATWVAHDLTHLGQIGEVLARRYREEVGPWRQYMPALDRTAEAE